MTDDQLKEAIKYIQENCTPTDVFDRETLIDWIAENEDPTDVFPLTKIITSIKMREPA